MSTYPIYEEVLQQACLLSPKDQVRLLEALATKLRQHIKGQQYHSIPELKGLGKELWPRIDVEKYIEEERNPWRG